MIKYSDIVSEAKRVAGEAQTRGVPTKWYGNSGNSWSTYEEYRKRDEQRSREVSTRSKPGVQGWEIIPARSRPYVVGQRGGPGEWKSFSNHLDAVILGMDGSLWLYSYASGETDEIYHFEWTEARPATREDLVGKQEPFEEVAKALRRFEAKYL